jgi:hypothetical protein
MSIDCTESMHMQMSGDWAVEELQFWYPIGTRE